MTDKELAGKVALVTGGSRGLGAASARRLAASGADVAIAFHQEKDKAAAVVTDLRAVGVRAELYQADLGIRVEAEAMVEQVASDFGKIDIVVNSAGIFNGGPMGSLPAPDVERLWAVNVHGTVATTQAAVAHMPDGGRIVLMGSVVGQRAALAGFADYSATKAALAMYARSWAHELAPRRITANTVSPGFSMTDMGIPQETDLGRWALAGLPFHRYAEPEEVADAVAFLAGPGATYVSGVEIPVDGGWNA
ncbi:SDR family NAD(P)-dependent oxidoreductase [Kibdelosporangium aridum]|uniref:SDR family NAD(P)-dependent oxidoreductase n=1 Tax=Kibdelosporangium aridum TaxID=2030 RepID=UPI00052693E2